MLSVAPLFHDTIRRSLNNRSRTLIYSRHVHNFCSRPGLSEALAEGLLQSSTLSSPVQFGAGTVGIRDNGSPCAAVCDSVFNRQTASIRLIAGGHRYIPFFIFHCLATVYRLIR